MLNTVVAYVCGNDVLSFLSVGSFFTFFFPLLLTASCKHRECGELCARSEGKICPSLILPIHG